MRLSQCMNLYAHHNVDFAIEQTAKIGFTGIEMWGGRPHIFRDEKRGRLKELRKKIEDLGMVTCDFIPPVFKYPVNLMSADEGIRRDSIDFMKSNIYSAAQLGSPTMNIAVLWPDLDCPLSESYGRLVKSLTEMGTYAMDQGVNLVIESSPKADSPFLIMMDDCLDMIKTLDQKCWGVLLDVGHLAVNREDFEQSMLKVKHLPLHVHIDDNDFTRDAHWIPGEGNINIQAFIDVMEKNGYSGYYSAEVMGDYTFDPVVNSQKCYDAMVQYFKK